MISILLYSFIFIFTYVHGGCEEQVEEDVIFLLDYSSSMDQDQFGLMKDFAARLVLEKLPTGSRVACVGFGTYPATYFYFDKYQDINDMLQGITGNWVTIPENYPPADYSALINRQALWIGGRTNMASAINAILNGNPDVLMEKVLDDRSRYERRTLLIIFTDGIATDLLGGIQAELFESNTKTIVIGIGDQFISEYVEAIVADPSDIKSVESFEQLDEFFEEVGDYICSSDAEVSITEFKTTGTDKFIEILNHNVVLTGEMLKITSNILPTGNYTFNFPDSSPVQTGDVIILHEPGVNVNECAYAPKCHPINYGSSFTEQVDFDFTFQQLINTEGGLQQPYIHSAALSYSSFTGQLAQVGDEYTYEIITTPNEASQIVASNWRRSCEMGGSPGNATAQFQDCEQRCTPLSDSSQGVDDCYPGTCEPQDDGQYGCTCPPLGYRVKKDKCESIGMVKGCAITGKLPVGVELNDDTTTFQAVIEYNYTDDSKVPGYTFVWDGTQNAQDFSLQEPRFTITSTAMGMNTTTMRSVGDYLCGTVVILGEPQMSCSVYTSSDPILCENQLVRQETASPTSLPTTSPTTAPSGLPSQPPVYSQPSVSVFVSKWESIPDMYWSLGGNGQRQFNMTQWTTEDTVEVSLRIYGTSESFETEVSYGLYEILNETHEVLIQDGTHIFPPNALYVADQKTILIERIAMVDGDTEKTLQFRVHEATAVDSLGRPTYTLEHPSKVDMIYTYEAPLILSESESEGLPWYTWPAIGGGALLVILVAGYIVYKFRKKASKAEKRREEAEEDVRRAEDGFFQTMDVVTDNPLQEIKLRHKQKDTVTLTDNVQMITLEDDDKFEMTSQETFATQVSYQTGGYSEGSRMPHRKVSSNRDPDLYVTPDQGNYPDDDFYASSPRQLNIGNNTDSRFSNVSMSTQEIEEGSLPAAFR